MKNSLKLQNLTNIQKAAWNISANLNKLLHVNILQFPPRSGNKTEYCLPPRSSLSSRALSYFGSAPLNVPLTVTTNSTSIYIAFLAFTA